LPYGGNQGDLVEDLEEEKYEEGDSSLS